jgi:hypothetical protein
LSASGQAELHTETLSQEEARERGRERKESKKEKNHKNSNLKIIFNNCI